MKAKFFALVALVLGLASCQNDPSGLNVSMGGEVLTTVNVGIPESETRAGGVNSAQGAITNIDLENTDYTLRYIFQVFDENGTASKDKQVKFSDDTDVAFEVRLVPERKYTFVVWADIVEESKADNTQPFNYADYHYNTANFPVVAINENTWVAMDETRDAFTGKATETSFTSASDITVTLTRPFAKLRVVTTDMASLGQFNIVPHNAVVTYKTDMRTSFNAFEGLADGASLSNKTHTYDIASYGETGNERTIFADYFFADNDVVKFEMRVNEEGGRKIAERFFNTDINVKRNYLTTLKGAILTDGGDVNVELKPGLGGSENPDIDYTVITSGSHIQDAINNGGSYMLGGDIYVSTPDPSTLAATRSAVESGAIINLNGYEIKFKEGASIVIPAGKSLVITDLEDNSGTIVLEGNDGGFVNKGYLKIEGGSLQKGSVENQGGKIELEGGNHQEDAVENESGEVIITGDNIDDNVVTGDVTNYYAGLVQAFAEGGEYTLGASVELEQPLALAQGKELKLTIAEGAVLSIVDNTDKNFELIKNQGTLTIEGAGKMTVEATINSGWNRYSAVIANTVGGTLTVKGVTLEHLGGTDMAYGIDNLTNGKGTYAVTTVDGATIKSTYRAVRQFLNGIEATNELYVKAGAKLEGGNKAIFFHDPSAKANTGKLVVEEGAELYGGVYLFVTEGSTEWPVEVSVAASAIKSGEVTYKNVPEGYKVVEENGIWVVSHFALVSNADELVEALEAKKDVVFTQDIKIDPANMSNAYGTTGINVKYGQTIDGAGFTLDIQGAGGTWDSGINTTGGLIKDLTVTGSFRGIFINHTSDYSETVVLENVTTDGTTYTISCDQGLYQGLEAYGCTFNGWTSFAATVGSAYFENCYFGEGSGYAFCRPYAPTEFVGCEFEAGFGLNPVAKVSFENCKLADEALTIANIATLSDNLANVKVNGLQMVADGVAMNAEGEYLISNAAGLTWFSDQMNNKKNTFTGKTIKVVNDIDMAGVTYYGGSIASYPSYCFKGTFDGGEKVISNLTITVENDIYGAAALIPTLAGDGTTIKNVTLKNVNISSSHYAAGIWGYTTNDNCWISVTNCHVEGGTITGNIYNGDNADKVGGIGGIFYTGTVSGCSVKGVTISGYRDTAGIVGWAANTNATIKNNTIENVTINVNNATNYKKYTKRAEYDVNSYVGEGVGTAKIEGNTGEATINWGSIAE